MSAIVGIWNRHWEMRQRRIAGISGKINAEEKRMAEEAFAR
jgi:hypothetical protein